jgi:hypothetical protein
VLFLASGLERDLDWAAPCPWRYKLHVKWSCERGGCRGLPDGTEQLHVRTSWPSSPSGVCPRRSPCLSKLSSSANAGEGMAKLKEPSWKHDDPPERVLDRPAVQRRRSQLEQRHDRRGSRWTSEGFDRRMGPRRGQRSASASLIGASHHPNARLEIGRRSSEPHGYALGSWGWRTVVLRWQSR